MAEQTAIQKSGNAQMKGVKKASEILAEHLGLDPQGMINVIKAQCFKGVDPGKVTNEQLAAYVNVANSLREQAPNFNPLMSGMLYAFPAKNGGIEPMIGPDGIFALLSSRPDYEGYEFVPEYDAKGNLVSGVATIYMTGKRPFAKRCAMNEWKVSSNPNWNSRPLHMLEIRCLKQCARQVIHGIPLDPDERRIIEAQSYRVELDDSRPRAAQLAAAIATHGETEETEDDIPHFGDDEEPTDLAGGTDQ